MAWNPFGQQSNPNPGWGNATLPPSPSTVSNPGASLPPSAIPPPQTVTTPGGTLPGLNTGALPAGSSQADANWLNYGGSTQGPQQWTNYYQGLGATASQLAASQGAAAQAQAGAAMNPYSQLGTSNSAAWNGAAAGSMGMGNLAQQQLSGAAGGTDQVSGILQGQVGGNAGLSSLATGGVSSLGQFAQGGNAQLAAAANGQTPVGQMLQQQALGQGPSGAQTTLGQGAAQAIHAQMAAAASTRGGAATQAAAQQQGALQGAQISGQAIGQAAQEKAQEQLSGQQQLANYTQTAMGQNAGLQAGALGQNAGIQATAAGQNAQFQQTAAGQLANYTQGAQTGLASAANSQLGTAGNLGLGYGNLGEGAAATGLNTATQAGEAYSAEGLQAQQTYEQMAQQVQQNELQGNLAQNQANKGLQGTEEQIQSNNTNAAIGGTAAGTAAFFSLFSDENVKADIDPQGSADPGSELPAPESNATGVTPYKASTDPTGGTTTAISNTSGLTKEKIKEILAKFRGGIASALAPRPVVQAPMPNIGMPGQPLTMSDERTKKDVKPAPTADALLALLAKSKSTFSYKNPQDEPLSPMHAKTPGARFGGVMAQDLERTPEIGRQLVTDTPRGKMLEPQAVQSAILMGLGRIAERLTALEGARQ